MTKRIFRAICLVALAVLLASAALFMGALYDYFSNVQRGQLRTQTELAAQGVSHEGMAYFDGLDTRQYRVTWVGDDGTVRYDSARDQAEMENHLEREEVQAALAHGIGESARYSDTLLERSLYCAKRLSDGTALRLSITQSSLLNLVLGMLQPVLVILVLAIVLSLVLAHRISKRIVGPLNALDLDHPLDNEGYDELSPLLRRLKAQQGEIRRQSAELRRRQAELDTVTAGMKEGLVLLNRHGTVLSANPAARALLEDAAPVGKDILMVNRSLALQELLEKAGRGEYAETVLELGGGAYQLDASPVIADGEASGTVLLLLDVGEKRRAEQMRREFTANVSHELKTPLQAISGSAELLAGGIVKQEDVAGFGARIYAEAQRMIALVEDIIRLSRLDEGGGDARREEVDLNALAAETLSELDEAAARANVALSLAGEEVRLRGIPQLLRSILFNLCDNAIKYNRPGGTVTVTLAREEEGVALTVEDTGVGIPPECQERVFERFYRVDKSRSKAVGGTGLGLSIVKHAVQLHRGSIELTSRPGEGTAVTVRLPQ